MEVGYFAVPVHGSRVAVVKGSPSTGRTNGFYFQLSGAPSFWGALYGLPYVRKSQQEYEAKMKENQCKTLKWKASQLGPEFIEKLSAGSERRRRRYRDKRRAERTVAGGESANRREPGPEVASVR